MAISTRFEEVVLIYKNHPICFKTYKFDLQKQGLSLLTFSIEQYYRVASISTNGLGSFTDLEFIVF